MNRSRPRTRQFREHGQAEDRTQSRLNRVRRQSASASSPRHQARQQSVRVRDKDTASTGREATAAKAANSPPTGRNPELSVSAASVVACIGREPEQVENWPGRRIAVAISRSMRFPVHIRNI